MRRLLLELCRGFYHRLLSDDAKNTLAQHLLLERADAPPVTLAQCESDSVVVLAPHMDDEILGCGGTLRRHVLAGARVTVIFLTDGAALDPTIAPVRQEEARAVARLMGFEEPRFLEAPDGELLSAPGLSARLERHLNELQPTLLYLPSVLETHPDHWKAHKVLGSLLERASPGGARILRLYEVWTPLVPNLVVEISPVFEEKCAALAKYSSQHSALDLEHVARGLAAYRSIHTGAGRGFFEAFLQVDRVGYARLLERTGLR